MNKWLPPTLVLPFLLLALPVSATQSDEADRAQCVASPTRDCLMHMARDTAQGIDDPAVRAMALADIASAQAKNDDYEAAQQTVAEALEAADGVEYPFLRAQALSVIAAAQAKAGDEVGAKNTIASAVDAAHSVEDPFFGGWALRIAAESLTQTGDYTAAIEIANSLKESHFVGGQEIDVDWRSVALRHIAKTMAQDGDTAGATDITKGIDDYNSRSQAFLTIAEEQGKGAGGTAALLHSVQRGAKGEAAAHTLSGFAKHQAEDGHPEVAKQILMIALDYARTIEGPVMRARALNDIVRAQAHSGDIAGAHDTAHKIGTAAGRVKGLSIVAKQLAEDGDLAGAKQTLAEALDAANDVDDPFLRAWAFGNVAEAQGAAGDAAAAKQSFATALDAARSTKAAFRRAEAMGIVAVGLADAGKMVEAVDVALGIESPGERARTLRTIAVTGGSANKPEDRKDWVD